MKWSDQEFRARVERHAARVGLTVSEVLSRARLTEDYLRRVPSLGRNVGGIFKIAEVLDINPAELMGLELAGFERPSALTIATIVEHLNISLGKCDASKDDLERIVRQVLQALNRPEQAKPRPGPAEKPKD